VPDISPFSPTTLGPRALRNRLRDVAHDAQPRQPGRSTQRAHGRVLRPARHRRTHRHRGYVPLAERHRISAHSRLWSPEQVAGWRLVTDAVHAGGGTISRRSCTPAASAIR